MRPESDFSHASENWGSSLQSKHLTSWLRATKGFLAANIEIAPAGLMRDHPISEWGAVQVQTRRWQRDNDPGREPNAESRSNPPPPPALLLVVSHDGCSPRIAEPNGFVSNFGLSSGPRSALILARIFRRYSEPRDPALATYSTQPTPKITLPQSTLSPRTTAGR